MRRTFVPIILLLCGLSIICAPAQKLGHNIPNVNDENPIPKLSVPFRLMVIPHSHDDVGWLDTPNEYYNNTVKSIYDSAVEALWQNPTRRFISVEMAYFSRWWNDATRTQKEKAAYVIQQGQLEFVSGGWSMEDEACTTYSANIDQMTEGHLFINDLFGSSYVPKFGWQVDPFGASTVCHGHFAQMNFEATLISRVDTWVKVDWEMQHQLQFIWNPIKSNENVKIWTHMMDEFSYTTPVAGLDWSDGNAPVTPGNVAQLARSIQIDAQTRATYFPLTDQYNAILFPWGTDFAHDQSLLDFQNMDKIFAEINNRTEFYGMTIEYATLGEYFKAVHDANVSFHEFGNEDFFPYADNPSSFWSGYYTSRSALKGFARTRENLQRATEMLFVLKKYVAKQHSSEEFSSLVDLRHINGEATHHDAVAGTSTDHVTEGYLEDLQRVSEGVDPLVTSALTAMVCKDLSQTENLSETNPVQVVLFNSLGWKVQRWVSVPIYRQDVQVKTPDGVPVPSQVLSAMPSQKGPCMLYESCGYEEDAPYRLYFAAELPPLGYQTYVISVGGNAEISEERVAKVQTGDDDTFTISNSVLSLEFSTATGQLQSIENLKSGVFTKVANNYYQYTGQSDPSKGQCEGAYILRPMNAATIVKQVPLSYTLVTGPYVNEVRLFYTAMCESLSSSGFSCGISQVIRLFTWDGIPEVENFIEISHSFGPLLDRTDLITRFETDINSGSLFWTDNNCFEMKQRTFDPKSSEYYAGNYYPSPCGAFLEDQQSDIRLTVLNDRTRGVSSMEENQLEVMLHRRTSQSDYRGPLALDDTDRLENVKTWLILDTKAESDEMRHTLQQYLNFPPVIAVGPLTPTAKPSFSAMKKSLPPNVHLLTFRTPHDTDPKVLLRLVNLYQVEDVSSLASEVTLNLKDYFDLGSILSSSERTLNAVFELQNAPAKWDWNSDGIEQHKLVNPPTAKGVGESTTNPVEVTKSVETRPGDGLEVSLKPLEIRTFYVRFSFT